MFNYVTQEKVEEVIHLAEKADWRPDESADEPRRATGENEREAALPLFPQPAEDWRHALPKFLRDFSDEALQELESLYEGAGHGGAHKRTHAERASYLASRTDLADRLRRALVTAPIQRREVAQR
jgi:hypothetical protein